MQLSEDIRQNKQESGQSRVLVNEYIDDGITGTLLERPALDQLRQDAKSDLFDRVYFHAADRIAREIEYQRIIIGELLKRGKQLTIGGKQYEETPVPLRQEDADRPGRAKLSTKPAPAGSGTSTNTTGTVRVACSNGATPAAPVASTTSG